MRIYLIVYPGADCSVDMISFGLEIMITVGIAPPMKKSGGKLLLGLTWGEKNTTSTERKAHSNADGLTLTKLHSFVVCK